MCMQMSAPAPLTGSKCPCKRELTGWPSIRRRTGCQEASNDCTFTPFRNGTNVNVTSSIMYMPALEQVRRAGNRSWRLPGVTVR